MRGLGQHIRPYAFEVSEEIESNSLQGEVPNAPLLHSGAGQVLCLFSFSTV